MIRLRTLATLGDVDAAARLLVAARRLNDDVTCMEACRVLVAGGIWREPLAYYERRVKMLAIYGGPDAPLHHEPIDCHELVGAIQILHGRMYVLRPESVVDIEALWRRAGLLWWPDGWDAWLAKQLYPYPDVPECVCLDAGMERGRCPGAPDEYCHYGVVTTEEGRTYAIQKECGVCNGTGRCPRCGHD
jgi:hypothetical protein